MYVADRFKIKFEFKIHPDTGVVDKDKIRVVGEEREEWEEREWEMENASEMP